MDTVAVVGRLLLSLAFVLGLMWLIAKKVKRGPGGRGRNGRLIDVLSRQQLSRTASVAVVRVMDQALIIGVTDGQISVLGDTDLAAAQASLETPDPPRPARARTVRASVDSEHKAPLNGSALSPGTWKQTLETLRDLTARKT
jgi:flagellar protein FliO/FliZ